MTSEATLDGDLVSGGAAADTTAAVDTSGTSTTPETDTGIEADVSGTSGGEVSSPDPADGLL